MSDYRRKKRDIRAEINIVPYIDVMLVLLIIFMVTSPFITQGVDVELPKTASAKPTSELAGHSEASFIVIEIDKNGALGISANNETMVKNITLAEIIERIKAERTIAPDTPIAVGGDAKTPYADVVILLDELTQAGIDRVGLLTDVK